MAHQTCITFFEATMTREYLIKYICSAVATAPQIPPYLTIVRSKEYDLTDTLHRRSAAENVVALAHMFIEQKERETREAETQV